MDCADLNCIDGPKQVGTVIDVSLTQAGSEVLTLLTLEDSFGEEHNIALRVAPNGIIEVNHEVWFDELDCSETALAWLEIDLVDLEGGKGRFFPPAFEDYAIVSDELKKILLLEFFEDSLAESPFYSNEINAPGTLFVAGVTNPEPWQDLQGFVKLTMLRGSYELVEITIEVHRTGERFSEIFPVDQLLNEADTFVQGFEALPFVGTTTSQNQGIASILQAPVIPVRALYVAVDDFVFNGTSRSKAVAGGCESPFEESFSGVLAEKIVNDLHTDFPPPYTLEIEELALDP